MALKAGREGVNPSEVDLFGKLKLIWGKISGSITDQQDLKQALDAKVDKSITTGTVTTTFTVQADQNYVKKQGNIVFLALRLGGVNASADVTSIGTVPSGFRPSTTYYLPITVVRNGVAKMETCFLYDDGKIKAAEDLDNESIRIFTTYMID